MIMRASEDGYTLIELLVVLALMGFVAAAVTGGIQFGSDLWASSEASLARAQNDAAAQGILRQLLAHATPRRDGGFVKFEGTPSMINFDGDPPAAFEAAGPAHLEISILRSRSGEKLVLKVSSILDDRETRSATLADGLTISEFSYLDGSEKTRTWLAFWRDRKQLPDAVQLRSKISGVTAWSLFEARLPIAEGMDCKFDPISARCRT